MIKERINIKGTSDGLVITVGSGIWPGLVEELNETLQEKASFFKGGRVAVRVGPRQLTLPQIETLGQTLSEHGVTLWAVESDSLGTQDATRQLGLETGIKPARTPPVGRPAPPAGNSLVIRRTLRSGQILNHPGHIVIIGDVNPGAEIKAGGSVIVWGRLRGTVHAGVDIEQEDDAVICALQLSPMQLRIGDLITRAPAYDGQAEIIPEMASIQDGQIVAEPWNE